jgi:hypothetical protein
VSKYLFFVFCICGIGRSCSDFVLYVVLYWYINKVMRYFFLKMVIDQLLSEQQCTACGKEFCDEEVSVLGVGPGMGYLALSCSQCQLVVTVCVSERSHRRLTRRQKAPLTQDEIISMVDSVKNLEGGFESFFWRSAE